MRLYSDWAYLEQEFGCSIRDHFLMAIRSLDNPKAVTPFLIDRDGRRAGLFLHVEKGNVEAARLPRDIAPVFYRPYFTFEESERPPHVHPTLTGAVEAVADGKRAIVVDRSLPVAVARELAARFSIEPEPAPDWGTVTARKAPNPATVARLGRDRAAAAGVARRLLAASPARARIEPYLDHRDGDRFGALDVLMGEAGLDALIVSSTLNVQEVAGVPVRAKPRPLAAVYVAGAGCAWVIESGRGGGGRAYASPAAALRNLCRAGRIGIEAEDVDVGLARALGLDERDHAPADGLLRRWRDSNTLPDLPFYVIATRASAHAMERALDFAAEALKRAQPITEMDSFAVYLDSLRAFVADAMPGLRVARTLTNFHTGRRTIFPANPAAFPVDGRINTLKIDAGCLLLDAEGYLLGCSDIARTLSTSEPARQLYQVFADGVRRTLIPGAAAGRAGEALHRDGVDAVWGRRSELVGNPLFVDLADPARDYDRDVGHLLGKNNLAHLRLVNGDRGLLAEGMIACCEYQWPLKGHAVAYEDTCLVTPAGGINLTSDIE